MGYWEYSYNEANQLVSWEKRANEASQIVEKSATLSYDDAGNRTGQSVAGSDTSYTWDAQDRLTRVTMPDGSVHSYDYDYRTRRIGTTEGTSSTVPTKATAIVFSGGLSVAEWETTDPSSLLADPSSPTVEYTRGPDMGGGVGGMLYSLRSGTPKYSLSNGRGDIVAQADQSATLTWTASYEAYGKRTKETGTNLDKQRANSKDEDPTGLLNEGFRYRDLETGVWLSRDPAGLVDGPNLYAYVMQNPWTGWDPHGLADGSGFFSDFGGQLWDNAAGAYEYVAYGLGAGVETMSGGMLYSGCNEKFNRATVGAVKGVAHMGSELSHAALRTGMGDFSQAGQHVKNALGDTPGKALANLTTIVATEGLSRVGKGSPIVEVSESASVTAAKVERAVILDAPEVQAQLKASAMAKGDTYGHLTDHPSVGPGKLFTSSALEKAKADNMKRNSGVLRDDVTGEKMAPSVQATAGSKVDPTSVQGDHVQPRVPKDPNATPGSNSFSNLKLRRASHNREKSNN